MSDTNYQQEIRKAIRPKFRGKKRIHGRTIPRYPDSAEREFRRVGNAVVREMNAALKKELPNVIDAYKKEMRKDSREDGISDFTDKVRDKVMSIGSSVEKSLEDLGVREALEHVSTMTQRINLREWKRTVKEALGVDIDELKYKGEMYEQALKQWVSDNLAQIMGIPSEALLDIQKIIMDSFREGSLIGDLRKKIQDRYNQLKRRVQLLARDQISTLNAKLTEMRYKSSGVTKYIWSSVKDERVRECHRAFDGKVFSFDDPPEAWYTTKSRGVVHTGRRCNPGCDYCCRCIAIPVFDIDTVDVPVMAV